MDVDSGRNPFLSAPLENDFQCVLHRHAVFEDERTLPPLSAGSATVIRLMERAMLVDPAQRFASLGGFRDRLSAAHALESLKVKEQLGRFVREQTARLLSQPLPPWATVSCW